MIIGHCHGIQNLGIDSLILKIDDVHFLSDALQCSLSAKCRKISSHITMRLLGNLLQIDLLI